MTLPYRYFPQFGRIRILLWIFISSCGYRVRMCIATDLAIIEMKTGIAVAVIV